MKDLDKCTHCGNKEAKVRLQLEEEYIILCMDCFNKMMADDLGVELEELIETFTLGDHQGVSLTFYVERRLYPNGFFLEAVENIEYGYKFAVHGDLDDDQQELLNKLVEKTRKGIAEQHVEKGIFPDGKVYQTIRDNQIKGTIEYNEMSGDTPLIIIDGKPFTWEEVGKMVTTFEGSQVHIKLYDMTEDTE